MAHESPAPESTGICTHVGVCDLQAVQPGYPYPVSTSLIPENVFVAAAHVPTRTRKAVASALYRYQPPSCCFLTTVKMGLSQLEEISFKPNPFALFAGTQAQLCQSQSSNLQQSITSFVPCNTASQPLQIMPLVEVVHHPTGAPQPSFYCCKDW